MRFSTRRMLEIVAFVALLCMMFFALPDTAAYWSLVLTSLAVPSLAIPVIVYSSGNARAFAIGVLSSFGSTPFAFFFLPLTVGTGSPTFLLADDVPGDRELLLAWKIFFASIFGSALLLGLASVAIRNACLKEQSKEK